MGGRSISVLNVAEKPSVAKSVSAILSRNQGLRVRDGRSRYNKIFEFNYSIRGQPCHMLFTSVIGHLMELEFEERYRKWHSCDPADLHAPSISLFPGQKGYQENTGEEARSASGLFCGLNCDREGENIAFEVVDEIHQAVQNLVEPNKWFADAVDARQEIDLRIGASFTRFQTMLMRDAFVIDIATDDRNLVLSYGPCQFPHLDLLWKDIGIYKHEPEEFCYDFEMCIENQLQLHQEKLKYPPHPLNTIELEKRASHDISG
ncbi:TOPRIM domain [Sesbania bispinosa]|nr:TOPRIM domain [Sesbania bispinosa]